MPNALTFIIGADSQPFAREMRQMDQLALTAGRSIGRNLAESANHSYAGIIRESITIGREAIEGRGMGRIIGSSTLLLQYLRNLFTGTQEAGGAAKAAAEAYEVMAFRQQVTANATAKLAASLVAEVDADAGASEESIANALAATEQAAAQNSAALAFRNKAAAAANAAEVEATEAAIASKSAPIGILTGGTGLIVGGLAIVVTIAAAMYGVYKWAKATADVLAGFKTPDFHPEYIAKHLQAVNQTAEGWKRIQEAVDKTTESYNSAAEAAKRITVITTAQFDHEKRMLTLSKERDLSKSTSAAEREAIEKKYNDSEVALDKKRHDKELENRQNEVAALKEESNAKKSQADSIRVNSKEHDENNLRNKKLKADEAQKYLDDIASAKTPEERNKILKGANWLFPFSGVKSGDYDEAARKQDAEARARIKAYDDEIDTTATNDETRKKKDELVKQAAEAAAAAAKGELEIPDIKSKFDQEDKDEAEEKAVKDDTKSRGRSGGERIELNELQRIGGAYAIPALTDANQIARDSNRTLHGIKDRLDRTAGHGPSPGAPHY